MAQNHETGDAYGSYAQRSVEPSYVWRQVQNYSPEESNASYNAMQSAGTDEWLPAVSFADAGRGTGYGEWGGSNNSYAGTFAERGADSRLEQIEKLADEAAIVAIVLDDVLNALAREYQPTTPDNPQPRTPDNPQPTRPDNPQPKTPDNPQPTRPDNPQPKTPDNPQPKTPDNPQPKTPDNPQPKTPDNPQPKTPDNPQPKTQDNPQPKTPDNPQPEPPTRDGGGSYIDGSNGFAGTLSLSDASDSAAPASSVVAPNGQTYKLAFNDEFNEKSVSQLATNWDFTAGGQYTESFGQGTAEPGNLSLSNGALNVSVYKQPNTVPGGPLKGKEEQYTDGSINTKTFKFGPGSIMMWRGTLNYDHATGWATTVTAANPSYTAEIDNGERLPGKTVDDQIHKDPTDTTNGQESAPPLWVSKIDPTKENTYTAIYNKDGTVTFYVTPNGSNQAEEIGTSSADKINDALSAWFGVGVDDGAITTTGSAAAAGKPAMSIDWVRIYSQ